MLTVNEIFHSLQGESDQVEITAGGPVARTVADQMHTYLWDAETRGV